MLSVNVVLNLPNLTVVVGKLPGRVSDSGDVEQLQAEALLHHHLLLR